jgi:hypothetical protein
VKYLKAKWVAFTTLFSVTMAALVVPAVSLATESEAEKKVKEVTTQVSSEGVNIIIAVLAGLVALIALSIVLPKAIGFIRRFV